MTDRTSTTAAKAYAITPSTALPDASKDKSESQTSYKSNLPATNLEPSPPTPPNSSSYPAAAPGAAPPAPTASLDSKMSRNNDQTSDLDDTSFPQPTKTSSFHSTFADPPAPTPGAFPVPVSPTSSHRHKSNPMMRTDPPEPAPSNVPSSTTTAAQAIPTGAPTSTGSIPAPTFTMPPTVALSSPEVTMRGQPIPSTTSTAETTHYQGFANLPSESNNPPGYVQNPNVSREVHYPEHEGEAREEGLLGKLGQAVDKVNEWIVGDKGSAV